MTAHRDLKNLIRERQQKTGESYTAARVHVMHARAKLLGHRPDDTPTSIPSAEVEAVILRVNRQSARVRILGEAGEVTFRSGDVWSVVPGHVVSLAVDRRWTWLGAPYASGRIERARIDVARLDLLPLPLMGGELRDVRSSTEPHASPDPYAPLWKRLTAKPRPSFEFDHIAWGQFPGSDPEENPTCEASELIEAGDREGARELLMKALGADLRCLDAHALLGYLEFDRSPERAIAHYELGVRIGELSVPVGFDGLIVWGRIYNRPFLRCLHGYGLCLWRLSRALEASRVFQRILSMNPNDLHQGVRFCLDDIQQGGRWPETHEGDEATRPRRPGASASSHGDS